MKRTFQSVLLLITVLAVAELAGAGCVGKSVNAFGAKGDGHTDDTAAIQTALDAAAAQGGGSAVLNVARYFVAGTLFVPRGVVLCGAVEGPFDVQTNPATTTLAPTLLVTSLQGPFITLGGDGSGVTDVLFHYPHQVATTASAPRVYPFTIQVNGPGTKVARCTVTNAYNFMDIEVGRFTAEHLFIGAYNYGVYIDHTEDFVVLQHLLQTVFWDVFEGAPYPTNIDNWVLQHGYALVMNRMDSLHVNNFLVFSRYAGFWFKDSPDTSLNFRAGYGSGSDIDLDTVQYGIIASATNQPGFKFSNIDIGSAPTLGKAAAFLSAGGTNPPTILINGGSERGVWADGPFPPPQAGKLTVSNVIGFNAN